jgi:hypothetical protein
MNYTSPRPAARRVAPLRAAPQRNVSFVHFPSRRIEPLRSARHRPAAQRDTSQGFIWQFAAAPRCAARRFASRRNTSQRNLKGNHNA